MYGSLSQLPSPIGGYGGIGQGGGINPMHMMAGAGLGGILGDIFSDPTAGAETYQNYLRQAMDALRQHEATGRGDITQHYQQALGFGDPYRTAGAGALGAYQQSLGLGAPTTPNAALNQFRASPGYQFALQQGLQGVRHAMAARGLGGSGAEMQALQARGQGLADQEYQRYQQQLAGLAGMGQQEAGRAAQLAYGTGGALAGLGQQYAQPISGLYGQMGQAAAQAEHMRAQRPGQILGDIGSLAGMFL